jgi:hypothetical protein
MVGTFVRRYEDPEDSRFQLLVILTDGRFIADRTLDGRSTRTGWIESDPKDPHAFVFHYSETESELIRVWDDGYLVTIEQGGARFEMVPTVEAFCGQAEDCDLQGLEDCETETGWQCVQARCACDDPPG